MQEPLLPAASTSYELCFAVTYSTPNGGNERLPPSMHIGREKRIRASSPLRAH